MKLKNITPIKVPGLKKFVMNVNMSKENKEAIRKRQ